MASGPIPGTQNLGAVSDCLTFGAGRGSPKALDHGLSGPEALGLYDMIIQIKLYTENYYN